MPRGALEFRHPSGIGRALRWGLVVTIELSVAALGVGTMGTYRAAPPIPDR
jgi:hypothetical protein